MPKRAADWHVGAFWGPDTCRAEAGKWERIAAEAEADGDDWYAADAKAEAAKFRQIAREKSVDAEGATP